MKLCVRLVQFKTLHHFELHSSIQSLRSMRMVWKIFPPCFLTSGSSSPTFSASSSIKPIKAHLLQLFYSFRVALHVNECLLSRSALRDRLASSPAACILNDENLSSDGRWRGRRRGYRIKSPWLWKLFQF